jgi:hypothetical protein
MYAYQYMYVDQVFYIMSIYRTNILRIHFLEPPDQADS